MTAMRLLHDVNCQWNLPLGLACAGVAAVLILGLAGLSRSRKHRWRAAKLPTMWAAFVVTLLCAAGTAIAYNGYRLCSKLRTQGQSIAGSVEEIHVLGGGRNYEFRIRDVWFAYSPAQWQGVPLRLGTRVRILYVMDGGEPVIMRLEAGAPEQLAPPPRL